MCLVFIEEGEPCSLSFLVNCSKLFPVSGPSSSRPKPLKMVVPASRVKVSIH